MRPRPAVFSPDSYVLGDRPVLCGTGRLATLEASTHRAPVTAPLARSDNREGLHTLLSPSKRLLVEKQSALVGRREEKSQEGSQQERGLKRRSLVHS